MLVPSLYLFYKVGDEKHLQKLSKGCIRCRSIEHYASKENEGTSFHDSQEGMAHIIQPYSGLEIKFGDLKIDHADLAGSVDIQKTLKTPVFCLSSINSGKKYSISSDEAQMFLDSLKISEKNGEHGSKALVITHPKEFLRRVDKAAEKQGISISRDFVEYSDFSKYHGLINNIGFHKDIKFQHQKEYRILFDSAEIDVGSPYYFDIGTISDISTILDFDTLRKSIRFSFTKFCSNQS